MSYDPVPSTEGSRRPIAARGNALVQKVSRALVQTPLTPNTVSVLGVFFATLGAVALLAWPLWGALVCGFAIQLRLLCNLFDGLIAVEGGKGTPTGVLFNEVPDRLADSVLLIALGYATSLPDLGYLAALLAVGTAYIRATGGSLGQPQDFSGPMAKQQRMATMTFACLLTPLELTFFNTNYLLVISLWIIVLLSALTCVLRLRRLSRTLRSSSNA